MNKGLITAVVFCCLLAGSLAAQSSGEIYKVVDENGNVTYTDQRPSAGAEPMDLPPLSVIESDVVVPAPAAQEAQAAEQAKEPTPRDLRRQFRDFRITQPQPEETFWGTANTVVVAWGASQPVPPELSARLFVDGSPQDVPGSGSVTLTLDRGEHRVYVELLDARKRRIIATQTVTFFVKQQSVGFKRPAPSPRASGR
ncbi:MAG: DUF4124 domain-containing protein [Xanthomonadales bacterium]|jgi:hypothetical protein|nr:DUF4124 domain-containing protein [Xanthomonadales bacterium]